MRRRRPRRRARLGRAGLGDVPHRPGRPGAPGGRRHPDGLRLHERRARRAHHALHAAGPLGRGVGLPLRGLAALRRLVALPGRRPQGAPLRPPEPRSRPRREGGAEARRAFAEVLPLGVEPAVGRVAGCGAGAGLQRGQGGVYPGALARLPGARAGGAGARPVRRRAPPRRRAGQAPPAGDQGAAALRRYAGQLGEVPGHRPAWRQQQEGVALQARARRLFKILRLRHARLQRSLGQLGLRLPSPRGVRRPLGHISRQGRRGGDLGQVHYRCFRRAAAEGA
mmetsp:Transcript_59172/g.165947  ORF Transcript_59172/g.165947 Transcript_59172/m.165947 type:complete len:281 (+) Transcript_59172:145-987(+)